MWFWISVYLYVLGVAVMYTEDWLKTPSDFLIAVLWPISMPIGMALVFYQNHIFKN